MKNVKMFQLFEFLVLKAMIGLAFPWLQLSDGQSLFKKAYGFRITRITRKAVISTYGMPKSSACWVSSGRTRNDVL